METQESIKTFLEKLKNDKKLEVYIFYHEAPIKQLLEINEVNDSKSRLSLR